MQKNLAIVAILILLCSAQQKNDHPWGKQSVRQKMQWAKVLSVADQTDPECPEAVSANAVMQEAVEAMYSYNPSTTPGYATRGTGCMIFNEEWWAYELCLGRFLRQFHQEKDVIHSEQILGVGPLAKETDGIVSTPLAYRDGIHNMRRKVVGHAPKSADYTCSNNADDASSGLTARAPVSTKYSGGTFCDLTNKPRTTTITLLCEPEESQLQTALKKNQQQGKTLAVPDIMFNVTEVAPCEYVAFLVGPGVCNALKATQRNIDEAKRFRARQQNPPTSLRSLKKKSMAEHQKEFSKYQQVPKPTQQQSVADEDSPPATESASHKDTEPVEKADVNNVGGLVAAVVETFVETVDEKVIANTGGRDEMKQKLVELLMPHEAKIRSGEMKAVQLFFDETPITLEIADLLIQMGLKPSVAGAAHSRGGSGTDGSASGGNAPPTTAGAGSTVEDTSEEEKMKDFDYEGSMIFAL